MTPAAAHQPARAVAGVIGGHSVSELKPAPLALKKTERDQSRRSTKTPKWMFGVECDGIRVGIKCKKAENTKDLVRKFNGWWCQGAMSWMFELDDASRFASYLSANPTAVKTNLNTENAAGFIYWGKTHNRKLGCFSSMIDVRLFNVKNEATVIIVGGFDGVLKRILPRVAGANWNSQFEVYIAKGKSTKEILDVLSQHAYIHRDEVYVNTNVFNELDIGAWRDVPKARLTIGAECALDPSEFFNPEEEDDPKNLKPKVDALKALAAKPLVKREINPEIYPWAEKKFGLRDYQTTGVKHLLEYSSALLADDMGLGKTRQSVVAARINRKTGVNIVIVPAYLRINWYREIKVVEPEARIWCVNVERINNMPHVTSGFVAGSVQPGWIVASYESIGTVFEHMRANEMKVDSIIFDEAHYIKEPSSQRTQKAFRLSDMAEHKILLTGTPILNGIEELYTLLRLSGHPLASMDVRIFKKTFGNSEIDRRALNQRIKEWMLRRSKKGTLNLKGKVRNEYLIEGSFKFWKEYRALEEDTSMPTLVKIGKARALLDHEKMLAAFDFISSFEGDEKSILFVNFKKTFNQAMQRAKMLGIDAVGFDGSCSPEYRQQAVDIFQENPNVKLIIITIDAGYSGWTLTAANWVFMASLPWTPSKLMQAEDRAYRLGQERLVNVGILKVVDTIDISLWEVLEYKAKQAAEVLESDDPLGNQEKEKKQALSIIAAHGFTPRIKVEKTIEHATA